MDKYDTFMWSFSGIPTQELAEKKLEEMEQQVAQHYPADLWQVKTSMQGRMVDNAKFWTVSLEAKKSG